MQATMALPSASVFTFGVAVLTVILLYLLARRHQSFQALTCPPGPKSPKMPTLDAWVQYREWGREYGDLVYIHETNMLITNSARVAVDLLEKRARIYSDREMTSVMKLCGAERVLSMERYSEKWRRNRRVYQQIFRQSTSDQFYLAQYKKINEFLRNLIASPERFMEHNDLLSQGLIYAALYGLDVAPEHPVAQKSKEINTTMGRTFLHDVSALELYPWLRFMPSWFPGCGFNKTAYIENVPFDQSVNNFKMGNGTSIVAELAMKNEGNPTMSSICSFLLTITLHPDVQIKAQAEIDRVIGRDRLPTFEDRKFLPYVEAIYREIMRLHPPLPLGISHVSTEDDVYEGYHIPQGCAVTPNIWAMNRDPNVYSEPDTFMPERFLDSPTGPFTSINEVYAFGFGRRVCGGRHMGDNTVWLAIASVLATLDLRKAKDSEGNEIDIPGEYTKTFFCHPQPFQCNITPRDSQARELVLATVELK
ncbi:cytochrome P450 2 Le.CYP2 [Rhodocollybia butyracea]|uniref:Cytochrome P450 2 Le.CYP2 n=1 Tax=Rhodocollybia butyracea TaxID=206335 RepID=A0A9P5Q3B8_9AGAR|nr:cytochrome P450 2 Le.CYP2 [Rhodocollybia butyracea]